MKFELIEIQKEFRADSRSLAYHLNHKHKNILRNIDVYISEFKELGKVTIQSQLNKQGSPTEYVLLNEDQCYFLLTLMRNNEKIVKAKLALVKSFRDARAQLAQRDLARKESKAVRHAETYEIQRLIDYAMAKGSHNAERYYIHFTKLVNKELGIESGTRDKLSQGELANVIMAENIIRIAISDGLKAEMEYKDIYTLCKMRVKAVTGLCFGKQIA